MIDLLCSKVKYPFYLPLSNGERCQMCFFMDVLAICTFEKYKVTSVDHYRMGSFILGKSKFQVVCGL